MILYIGGPNYLKEVTSTNDERQPEFSTKSGYRTISASKSLVFKTMHSTFNQLACGIQSPYIYIYIYTVRWHETLLVHTAPKYM